MNTGAPPGSASRPPVVSYRIYCPLYRHSVTTVSARLPICQFPIIFQIECPAAPGPLGQHPRTRVESECKNKESWHVCFCAAGSRAHTQLYVGPYQRRRLSAFVTDTRCTVTRYIIQGKRRYRTADRCWDKEKEADVFDL